jgi:YspA, cpYpsA-related SLOG family
VLQRIAIVGSRNYPRQDLVEQFVAAMPAGTIVVSGGARGVDRFAEEAAKRLGLEVRVFRADWDRLGAKAGPIRNSEIVANADRVVAFWNGKSRGTLDTVGKAVAAGLPVEVFGLDGEPVSADRWRTAAAALLDDRSPPR